MGKQTTRTAVVFGAAMLTYVVAMMHRSSLGVAGAEAAEHFGTTPSIVSTFVVLQLLTYAFGQIPSGVLLDRYGPRIMLTPDGKTLYEGIPSNGANFTWEAERQIVVNFGNAAAVELTFNGQPVGKIGDRGDVVVKTFTVAGMISAPVAPAPAAPSPAESTDKSGFNPAPTPTTPSSTSSPTAPPRGPVPPGTSGSRP